MINHDATVACVEGCFEEENAKARVQASIGFNRSRMTTMVRNGKRITSRREWFNQCALVCFGPDDLRLITGSSGDRRRFLDLLLSQLDTLYLEHLLQYNRSLMHRNRLLSARLVDGHLDVYEEQMAGHGAYLYAKRLEIMCFCQEVFAGLYHTISGGNEGGSLQYRPSISHDGSGDGEWENVFYKALINNRKRDLEHGFSTVGLHRDDLLVFLDKWPARTYASQGQCRSLALALKLSSVKCLQKSREGRMIFLVDDAFSELDETRIARAYPLIRDQGQVLLTSPLDRVPFDFDVPRYLVREGSVTSL